MPENIVDTGRLLRQFSDESESLAERSRPRFSPEQYHVARPQRMAHPSSYKRGGTVKRGGWAKVHKGEKVLTRRASAVLGKTRRRRRKPKASGSQT